MIFTYQSSELFHILFPIRDLQTERWNADVLSDVSLQRPLFIVCASIWLTTKKKKQQQQQSFIRLQVGSR